MGRVIVTAKIENISDLNAAEQGTITSQQVRSVEVHDALVDTGTTTLALPVRFIQQLGLRPSRVRQVKTATGPANVQFYFPAQLTIQGRDCSCEVVELPDALPVLIGQIPLELLDFVVDTPGQKLIGNPAHGGQHILDLF